MKYRLSNTERQYLGLEPIKPDWEYVELKGDQYRPDSTLVYENETIKRHIISTENAYQEYQYDDLTRERKYLLPKTSRGKEKKLTPSTFEKLSPRGVFFHFEEDEVSIANYTTQTTFYSTRMESIQIPTIAAFKTWLAQYIKQTTEKDQQELEAFKISKRKNVRAKPGDVFAFKIDRNNYGYGQIIENIHKLSKELPKNHDMNSIMGKALLIRLFHDKTEGLLTDVARFKDIKTTPSQYIFDNLIFYGEYPIIGNFEIPKNKIDFPISYGRVFGAPAEVQLQWGVIHKQKPVEHYNKHLEGFNELVPSGSPGHRINNPYSKSGVGWHLDVDKQTLLDCIEQNSNTPYWNQKIYHMKLDLRNPINKAIRAELFTEFGLDESTYYIE